MGQKGQRPSPPVEHEHVQGTNDVMLHDHIEIAYTVAIPVRK